MDTHKAQKTGNMYYIYLPSAWCAKHAIKSRSPISLLVNPDGTLLLSSAPVAKTPKRLHLSVDTIDQNVLIKLIVACYINPLSSFIIECKKEADITMLLDQKQFIGALDFIEFDGKKITYESGLVVDDPYTLFTGMIRKTQNLIHVITHNYNKELIMRYEDEIDRTKLMINKAVISGLAEGASSLSPVELHYLALLAQHVERLVDYMIQIQDMKFVENIREYIELIKQLMLDPHELSYPAVLEFTSRVAEMKHAQVSDLSSYYKRRVRSHLGSLSEVLLNWAITKEVMKKQ